jgi:hypothetical protein
VDEGSITTTQTANRCPACERRTATGLGPCPACGGHYRLDALPARPSIRVGAASPRVEAAWWALAIASSYIACVAAFAAGDLGRFQLVLAVPAVARAARMVFRGPTYPEMGPAPYLMLASLASYALSFLFSLAAAVLAFVGLRVFRGWGFGPAVWTWQASFVALHLLLWPRRRRVRAADHPPDDPEN